MFKYLADLISYDLLGLSAESRLGEVVNYFTYDSIRILALIFLVIFVLSFVRTFVSAKLENKLKDSKKGVANLLASLFGAVTPFCSCSSIPLFIGFLKSGIAPGVAFSFLITSPLVNEVALVMIGALFGWKIAFLYALSGITLGTLGGLILGNFDLEKNLLLKEAKSKTISETKTETLQARFNFAVRESKNMLKKLVPFVLLGVAIGAVIHGYIPRELIEEKVGGNSLWSVLVAVAIGVPVYAGCSTVVPVIFSISSNGVPLGTALAFMMSVAGLSLPEALILKRTMKLKLLGLFFLIVSFGIVLVGMLFNLLT